MITATTNPDPPTDEAIIVGHRIGGPTQIKAYALHRTQHTRFQVGFAISAYASEYLPGWNPVPLEESRSTLVSGECMTVVGFEAGRWVRRQPR